MKNSKPISSLRRSMLILAAVLLVAGVGFAPRPAMAQGGGIPTMDIGAIMQAVKQYAQDAAAWAKQQAQQSQIISTLIDTYNSMRSGFNSMLDEINKEMAVETLLSQAESKQKIDMANHEQGVIVHTASIGVQSQIAAERPPTPALDMSVCYKLHALQTNRNLRAFRNDLRRSLHAGRLARASVLGSGNGPIVSLADWQNRCGGADKVRGTVPDFLNPTDKNCSPADDEYKELYTNADINVTTLTTAIDRQALDEPNTQEKTEKNPITGESVKVVVPVIDPKEPGERLFLAAQDYCDHVAGPELAPPSGKELDTPDGRTRMATYSHCMSMKTALVDQCLRRIDYLTRPNKKLHKQNYEETVADCNKYSEVKSSDGKSILPSTVKCDKGLSPFQSEYLMHMACANSDEYVKKAGGGRQSSSLLDDSDRCMMAMTAWESKLNEEELAFLQSIQTLHDMKDCWGSK